VTVKGRLDYGLTFISGTGAGWSCTVDNAEIAIQDFTCISSNAIPVDTASTITVAVGVGSQAFPRVIPSFSVSTALDQLSFNNSTTDSTDVLDVPVPAFTITPTPLIAGQSASMALNMPSLYPHELTGTVSMSFTPAGTLPDDTAIQFATGGREVNFRIPANTLSAIFGESMDPGDLGFQVFRTKSTELGVLVCWDQWYPEAARLTAMQGAEILVYPTAIGWHPEEKAAYGERQHSAWETIQRSHAIANGCFVVAVNRTGFEPDPQGSGGIEFWGQSFIAGTDGRVLARGPVDREAVLVTEIDLGEIDAVRGGWPFFRDRRIDAYAGLTRRFGND
jgi:hypothetical protein